MIKNNQFKKIFLNIILFVSFVCFALVGCGKKDDSGNTSGNKSDKKSSDELNPGKPFYVEFEIKGSEKGTGKMSAYYAEKKVRSQSTMEVSGQKMTATAYYDGGEYMYMVSEFGGIKQGMKMKKDEFGKKEGEYDVYTFKDKLKEMDKIGEEEIIGRKCEIYKSKDGKYTISLYKEMVPLKFSSGDGKAFMVATKFETDVKVTDDMFTPPSDVKYTDATDMMKDLKNKTGNMDEMKDKMKEMEDAMKKYKK